MARFYDSFGSELQTAVSRFILYFPFLIAHSKAASISLKSTLYFTGLFNILSGLFFSSPSPTLQPLPVLSSLALARHLMLHEHMGASLMHAFIVQLIVDIARKHTHAVARWIPRSIIMGLKIGAGVLFAGQAVGFLSKGATNWFTRWTDNIPLALCTTLVFGLAVGVQFVTSRFSVPQHAPFIITLILGFGVALGACIAEYGWGLPFHVSKLPRLSIPLPGGFLAAGLPQVLVTIVDISDMATESKTGEGEVKHRSVTLLGVCSGFFNMFGSLFNALPVGFVPSSSSAVLPRTALLTGFIQLLCGVFLSTSTATLVAHFPGSIFGIIVIAVGLQMIHNAVDIRALLVWQKSNRGGYTLLGGNGPATPTLISPISSTQDLLSTTPQSATSSSLFTLENISFAFAVLGTSFALVMTRDGSVALAIGFGTVLAGWSVRSAWRLWTACRSGEAREWFANLGRSRTGEQAQSGPVSI